MLCIRVWGVVISLQKLLNRRENPLRLGHPAHAELAAT
jgi:hypothetical protein